MQQTATPEQFGSAVYKGLGTVGEAWKEYQDKQDTANVISAKNELQSRMTDLLYNKDTGLMFKEGAQANGLSDTFNTQYDNSIKDLRSQLNERQQQAFDQYTTNYKNSLSTHVTEHEIKQNDVALADSFKNLTFNTSKSISNAINNPDMVNTLLTDWENGTIATHPKKDSETVKRIIASGRDEMIGAAINTLYKQDDVDGVRKAIKLYGDKVSPDVIAPYQGWIEKKDIKVKAQSISDSLVAEFGPDGEEAAANKLKDLYGKDPNYDLYKRTLEGDMVDQRRYKKERKEQYENSVIEQVLTADSQAAAQSLVDNSGLDPKTRIWLENSYIKPKFKALAGKPTPEQKWASKYESNPNGMTKDLQVMQEYYALTTGEDAKELTPQQQTKYNMASIRLNRYQAFHGGGGYSGQQESSGMGDFKESEDTNTSSVDPIGKAIDKARMAGYSPEEIKQKLRDKKYGDKYDSWVW
jgi:hypothetical protein